MRRPREDMLPAGLLRLWVPGAGKRWPLVARWGSRPQFICNKMLFCLTLTSLYVFLEGCCGSGKLDSRHLLLARLTLVITTLCSSASSGPSLRCRHLRHTPKEGGSRGVDAIPCLSGTLSSSSGM